MRAPRQSPARRWTPSPGPCPPAVAGFAELLRDGDWARSTSFQWVADIAMRVSEERERVRDDEVAELARLAERAGWLHGERGYGGRIEEREPWPPRDEDGRDRDRWRGEEGRWRGGDR